jgi:cytochrome P460
VAALVVPGVAGPDKIKFPTSWKDHVLYSVVDRHDTKQYRELYASTQAAVDAMKAGKELPNGTVLTLVQYKAQVDAAGAPPQRREGPLRQGRPPRVHRRGKADGMGERVPRRVAQR